MDPVDFIYEAASVVTLGVAALSHKRDRRHALQIATILCASCFACNATRPVAGFWVWPFMDAAAAWFVAKRDRLAPRDWKLLIVIMYAGQGLAHIRWQIGDRFGGPFYGYGLTLNVMFVVQLLATSSSGIGRAGRAIRNYVGHRYGNRDRRRVAVLHRDAGQPREW